MGLIYPYEPIRNIPLGAARALGNEIQLRVWLAAVYLFVVFAFVPGLCLALYAWGDVALGIGSFMIFGTIASLITMRYLYLNPEVTMLGMDHTTVRTIFGDKLAVEVEPVAQTDAVEIEMPGVDVEDNQNYKPEDFSEKYKEWTEGRVQVTS